MNNVIFMLLCFQKMDVLNDPNDVPIFRLPDEILMNILTYITSIEHKMELEQVSRRFQFLSSNPSSWKGIHSLELMMKCKDAYPSGKYLLFSFHGVVLYVRT